MHAPGQPIPTVVIPEISERTSGTWSIWRISFESSSGREQNFLSVFVSDDGKSYAATARLVWEKVIASSFSFGKGSFQAGEEAIQSYQASRGGGRASRIRRVRKHCRPS